MQLGPMFKLLALRVVPGHLDRAIRPGSDGQRVLHGSWGRRAALRLEGGLHLNVRLPHREDAAVCEGRAVHRERLQLVALGRRGGDEELIPLMQLGRARERIALRIVPGHLD